MSRGVICSGVLFLAVAITGLQCTVGVDPSPHPGTIRVTLKSDESDTGLPILGDTTTFSRYDSFNASVFSGRVYRGRNYAPIYVNASIERIDGSTVNLIAREWLNGVPITIRDSVTITPENSRYIKYVIFESMVPPGDYDLLEFSLTATEVVTFNPRLYNNPVQLPPGTTPQLPFTGTFSVQDDKVTQIDIEILPFKSLTRYQDTFLFDRQVRIVKIQTF